MIGGMEDAPGSRLESRSRSRDRYPAYHCSALHSDDASKDTWLNDPNQMKHLTIDASHVDVAPNDYALALSILDDDCWNSDMNSPWGAHHNNTSSLMIEERHKSDDIYDEMLSLLGGTTTSGRGIYQHTWFDTKLTKEKRNKERNVHVMKVPKRIAPRPGDSQINIKPSMQAPYASADDIRSKRAKVRDELMVLAARHAIDDSTLTSTRKILASADGFILSHMADAIRNLPRDNSKLTVLLSIHSSLEKHTKHN